MCSLLRSIILSSILLGLLPIGSAMAQSAPVTYLRYDVHIDVRSDGDFDVRIIQQIKFHESFADAYYEVRHENIEQIVDTQVYEFTGDLPADSRQIESSQLETLTTNDVVEPASTFIEWQYASVNPGDVRIFVIDYRIQGGLWIYRRGDFLRWDAINRERSGVMIEQAQVTVRLPGEIPADSISATNEGAAIEQKQATTENLLTFNANQPLLDGEGVNVKVGFAHGYVSSDVQPWQKEIDHKDLSIHLSRVDTTLEVRANGQLHVTEQLRMKVERGTLYIAYRALDFLYLDNAHSFNVQQDGVTYSPVYAQDEIWRCKECYLYESSSGYGAWAYFSPTSGQIELDESRAGKANLSWGVPAMTEGEESTFVLDYVVEGAIRISDTAQSFVWEALPDYEVPIGAASVRLILPKGVATENVILEESRQSRAQLQADGSILLRQDQPIAARDRWSFVVTMPADATNASKPQWQNELENAIVEQKAFQTDQARKALATRTGGIFSAVLAALGGVLSWLSWGRKRVRETLYGYLSEPPSDLAPALVAYLVDQKTSEKGVLASIFHLASFGLLQIVPDGDMRIRRLREKPITAQDPLLDTQQKNVALPGHLDYLFNEVILPATPFDQEVSLNTIEPTLRDKLPRLFTLVGRELQSLVIHDSQRNLFSTPQFSSVVWFLFIGALFFLATSGSLRIEWLLILGLGSLALLGWRLWSQSKSDSTGQLGGASDTGRWIAFKNYLVNLKSYGDLAAAQTILDRYFAYAVAFGIESVVLEQAETMGSSAPTWLPLPTHDRSKSSQSSQSSTSRPQLPSSSGGKSSWPPTAGRDETSEERGDPAPAKPRPSLSGMSRNLAAAMAANSSSMGQLLSSAVSSDANTETKVTLNGAYYNRELSWKAGTSTSQVIDDIMRQSMRDTTPPPPPPAPTYSSNDSGGGSILDTLFSGDGSSSSGSSSGSSWRSSSRSSSSGGFGSSSRSSSSSSSRSSSSSSSGGGGRSGFGRR